jgi:hypothetical protein
VPLLWEEGTTLEDEDDDWVREAIVLGTSNFPTATAKINTKFNKRKEFLE